jgi:alpha-amylase
MSVAYLLENLPPGRPLHFAIEWNFAGLPSGADDRYFSDGAGNRLGQLGEQIDLQNTRSLSLSDRWLDVDVELSCDRDSGIWAFPIATVSQSEAGFELVHQSVCVMPHWIIQADAEGRWAVRIDVSARCGLSKIEDEDDVKASTRMFPEQIG